MFRMIDLNASGFGETPENRSCTVGRDRWGLNILVESQQEIASILVASLLDSTRAFPTVSQLVLHERGERPLIDRREHRSPLVGESMSLR